MMMTWYHYAERYMGKAEIGSAAVEEHTIASV